ncbi:unnamed protein product, partial [Symbiodinium sp. CCMP2592]
GPDSEENHQEDWSEWGQEEWAEDGEEQEWDEDGGETKCPPKKKKKTKTPKILKRPSAMISKSTDDTKWDGDKEKEEELEIKAFIHEYNRTPKATHKIMAYWSRSGFGLLVVNQEDTNQVAYCGSSKVDVKSNFLPIKQL